MLEVSFCIPTFNRGPKVFELVTNILNNCNDFRFEILVLDNLSTDDTFNLLSSIRDTRFRYILNNISLIGPMNILHALYHARGRFAFLCLDKDFILPAGIKRFIDLISEIDKLSFGSCELNAVEDRSHKFYEAGFLSVYHMSYLSAHPSGMFFNTELLRQVDFINRIEDKQKIFGFYPDIINAEMSILGPSLLVSMPLVTTENIDECRVSPSHTFKDPKSLYFTPRSRLNYLLAFSRHLNSLDLSNSEKYKVLGKIFRIGIVAATFGYKSIRKSEALCSHHFIKTKNITLLELIIIDLLFTSGFLCSRTPFSFIQKLRISLGQHVSLIFKSV
jgi:glycosyltransferase involved in cell wall biosynthesis